MYDSLISYQNISKTLVLQFFDYILKILTLGKN